MQRALSVILLHIAACHAAPSPTSAPTPATVVIPVWIEPMPVPAGNPLTVEGIELGRWLFYDPLLSEDGTVRCADCHQQAHGFSDPRPVSVGVHGRRGRRNSMPLFNLGWQTRFFWDGRATSLEEQVLLPMQDPEEMARDLDALVVDLQRHPRYPAMFDAAFPGEAIEPATIARALAQFVRSIVSFASPWDVDDTAAWSDEGARTRGHHLMSHPYPDAPGNPMLPCNDCHGGNVAVRPDGPPVHSPGLLTDGALRNNGLPSASDEGAAAVTGDPGDRGRFKVPSVRNLGLTGPYMHDGRFTDLRDVLRHYAHGVVASDTLDPHLVRDGQPLRIPFTERDIEDIVVFLGLLDDPNLASNPAWSDPFPQR